jgi:excisionase family DNA binding protein
MSEISDKGLLTVGDVARYMGVGQVTVHRWCREGRLPCSKVGKSWRIRRETLEDFVRRGERPVTLEGQLRAFLAVPDSVIAVVRNVDLLHRLDATFFRVGEARGGVLVKYHAGEPQASEDDLRAELERHGLEVERLEREGRFRFAYEPGEGDRAQTLRRLLKEAAVGGRSLWASFNWTERVDLDEALRQQEALGEVVRGAQLVVKTAVLEDAAEAWTLKEQRKAQEAHSGTIWLTEGGLGLSRVTPLPMG